MASVQTRISGEPLDVARLIAEAADPRSGGLGVFIGTVREKASAEGSEGKHVIRLEYEAHPSLAALRLREVAEEAASKWDLVRAVAVHREGRCELGDPTVVIACAAEHRHQALEACRFMIDRIKETVPVWKREVYTDGTAWVGVGA